MDLLLREYGDGGEFVKTPKDLQVVEGLQNMVYIALFGGNVEASTPDQRLASEQDFSFWGNTFLATNAKFNSQTERTLNEVALNSAGRVIIENAVKQDLAFMKDFADITVSVSIVATDRVKIDVGVQQPDNIQEQQFIFIWDATRSEIIADNNNIKVGNQPPPTDLVPVTDGTARVVNSDESYDEEVEVGDTLILEDYTIRTYLNGVLQDTQSVAAMEDIDITITI